MTHTRLRDCVAPTVSLGFERAISNPDKCSLPTYRDLPTYLPTSVRVWKKITQVQIAKPFMTHNPMGTQ